MYAFLCEPVYVSVSVCVYVCFGSMCMAITDWLSIISHNHSAGAHHWKNNEYRHSECDCRRLHSLLDWDYYTQLAWWHSILQLPIVPLCSFILSITDLCEVNVKSCMCRRINVKVYCTFNYNDDDASVNDETSDYRCMYVCVCVRARTMKLLAQKIIYEMMWCMVYAYVQGCLFACGIREKSFSPTTTNPTPTHAPAHPVLKRVFCLGDQNNDSRRRRITTLLIATISAALRPNIIGGRVNVELITISM